MSLKVLTTNEADEWDDIVRSFKDYDVYYLSGYVKAFELHGDGTPLLFYFNNGTTKAINVAMKRDIAKDKNFIGKLEENTYFDLATPYGYGGFIIEGNEINKIDEAYSKYCTNNNIISEFVRFHPVLDNASKTNGMYDVFNLGTTVCIDTSSQATIWSNLTSKNRNMIRKAQKSGIEIFWGRDEALIDKFIEIYNATMDKDEATSYYYFNREFYLSILNDLSYNAIFFYAKLNEEIIGMSIILFSNEKVHYHLSGTKREYQHLAPTNLLLYQVACWSSENGYKIMHLGGGVGARQDSLYKFKKAFNKQKDREFYIGKRIFCSDKYAMLIGKRENVKEYSSFFPSYRR